VSRVCRRRGRERPVMPWKGVVGLWDATHKDTTVFALLSVCLEFLTSAAIPAHSLCRLARLGRQWRRRPPVQILRRHFQDGAALAGRDGAGADGRPALGQEGFHAAGHAKPAQPVGQQVPGLARRAGDDDYSALVRGA